jgi:glycerol kinase
MKDDLKKPLLRLRVDGGAAANDVLMQYQSDISNLVVERPAELESTARGAAMLAGIGVGLYKDGPEAAQMTKLQKRFESNMTNEERTARLTRWSDAVSRAGSKKRGI